MNHLGEELSAFLDGELQLNARDSEHLAGCDQCRGEMDGLQLARAALRSLPLMELPAGLVPEADTTVIPLRRRTSARMAAAAVVAVILIGISAIFTPDRSIPISFDEITVQYGSRAQLDPGFTPGKAVPLVVIPVEDAE